MDGVHSNIYYFSFETHVAGIKLYPGFESLRPLTRVKLQRESENPIDPNSIVVMDAKNEEKKAKNGERIGHFGNNSNNSCSTPSTQ